ncbi:MAG: response regulator [Nitrospira sp.]
MTGYGKRVLIVEPDESERNVLGLMLENEGYHVQIVSDEGLALEELKRRRFDVVVSAHHMPQINGFRLILMGRLVWPDTPMIVLLGNDTSLSETVEQTRAYGYLRKPYNFGELLDLIENAIKLNRKHRLQTSKSVLLSS